MRLDEFVATRLVETQMGPQVRIGHARGHRLGSTLPCQAGRYDARHLCLETGVAYPVVVGEDGTCRCPFGVRHQQSVGRLSGTTALPPSHDTTHQLTNLREHLFPQAGLLQG